MTMGGMGGGRGGFRGIDEAAQRRANAQARLLQPLLGLMRVALDLQTSKALFARIFEYLDMIPAIQDAPDAIRADGAPVPRGQIEFRDVVFRFHL